MRAIIFWIFSHFYHKYSPRLEAVGFGTKQMGSILNKSSCLPWITTIFYDIELIFGIHVCDNKAWLQAPTCPSLGHTYWSYDSDIIFVLWSLYCNHVDTNIFIELRIRKAAVVIISSPNLVRNLFKIVKIFSSHSEWPLKSKRRCPVRWVFWRSQYKVLMTRQVCSESFTVTTVSEVELAIRHTFWWY